MRPHTRTQVVELLQRHHLTPRKGWGQHFLVDPNLTRKVVATAKVGPGHRVLEVGTGTGTLTRALAEAGAEVLSFEVDLRLQPLLAETLQGVERVEVRFADIMKLDLGEVLGAAPWQLVANLPYNIGTPLLLDLLRRVPAVTRFTVMVQLEVAERLTAKVGSAEYGLPSVVVALHADARVEFTVPPQVFFPPPQVASAVVTLERRPPPAGAEKALTLAAAGFGQRRKMLRRSLREAVADPVAVLTAAGIDPTARAEQVSPQGWLRLAEVA